MSSLEELAELRKKYPAFESIEALEKWEIKQKPQKYERCRYAVGRVKDTDEILCCAEKTVSKINKTIKCSAKAGYLGKVLVSARKALFGTIYVLDTYRCNKIGESYDTEIDQIEFMTALTPIFDTIDLRRIAEESNAKSEKDKVVLEMLSREIAFDKCSEEFKKLAYSLVTDDKLKYFNKEVEKNINRIKRR